MRGLKQEAIRAAAEAFVLMGASILIAFVLGFALGGDFVKREAIKHGSALEYVDAETGQSRFEWK